MQENTQSKRQRAIKDSRELRSRKLSTLLQREDVADQVRDGDIGMPMFVPTVR